LRSSSAQFGYAAQLCKSSVQLRSVTLKESMKSAVILSERSESKDLRFQGIHSPRAPDEIIEIVENCKLGVRFIERRITEMVRLKSLKTQVLRLASLAQDDSLLR